MKSIEVEIYLTDIDRRVYILLPFYPIVGDKIRIMKEGEPCPKWIRCEREDTWGKIDADGILITRRVFDPESGTLDFDGERW